MTARFRFDLEAAIASWRRFALSDRAISAEDAEELESHLRDEIDVGLSQGLDLEVAYQTAIRRMGDPHRMSAEYRDVLWKKLRAERRLTDEIQWRLAMLKSYLKTALRNLSRYKGHSFINVAGLALGMACCILIVLYVMFELSFDRFHSKADQIYRLVEIQSFSGRSPEHVGLTMGTMGPAMVEDFPEVLDFVRLKSRGRPVVLHEDTQFLLGNTFYADPSVFEMFDFELVAGDSETALDDPFSVVITESEAERFFGGADAVGRTLRLGGDDYQVTGVLKEVPRNSHLEFTALTSFSTMRDDPDFAFVFRWGPNNLVTYLLTRKDLDVPALEAKFPDYVARYLPNRVDNYELYLQPLTDIHLRSAEVNYDWNALKGSATTVYGFSAIAVLVLLIACINFMNLTTAHSARRAKEVGMRKAIGAQRPQLMGQFMGESLLMASMGLVIATGLVIVLAPPFFRLLGRTADFSVLADARVVAAVLGLTLLAGLVSGSYPALYLSRFRPASVLKGDSAIGGGGSLLRKSLVVAQFTISVVLIIGTWFVAQQFNLMRTQEMGFNKDQVLTFWLPDEIVDHYDTFRAELLQHPGIVGVTASTSRLGSLLSETGVRFEGKDPEENWNVPYNGVDYNFIPFYELQLVEGRNFSREIASDTTGEGGLIINEALKRKLGWETAVGKPFALGGGETLGTVIGVVEDFHFYSLHHMIEPLVFYPRPVGARSISVRLRTEELAGSIGALEDQVKAFVPDWPLSHEFLDDVFARLYQSEEHTGKLVAAFSFLAIVIACMGLFGLAAYMAEQRTKEIGVRKVLGASVAGLVSLLVREFLKLVAISLVIAMPLAYVLSQRWLTQFAYRTDPQWWVFVVSGLGTLLIALITVSYRSIRAATADPVKSLRYE